MNGLWDMATTWWLHFAQSPQAVQLRPLSLRRGAVGWWLDILGINLFLLLFLLCSGDWCASRRRGRDLWGRSGHGATRLTFFTTKLLHLSHHRFVGLPKAERPQGHQDWKYKVEGKQVCDFHINMIFQYDIDWTVYIIMNHDMILTSCNSRMSCCWSTSGGACLPFTRFVGAGLGDGSPGEAGASGFCWGGAACFVLAAAAVFSVPRLDLFSFLFSWISSSVAFSGLWWKNVNPSFRLFTELVKQCWSLSLVFGMTCALGRNMAKLLAESHQ